MGTATAQCPAAPKPQQYPPPPMPRPGPEHPPPAVLSVAELEAAVAALPGKRDALRVAFDRLAACSPSPLPFAWEDLDAHLSSLQWSISLRALQLRALEAARAAPAAAAPGEARGGGTGVNLEEEEEEDVVGVEEEVVEAAERVVGQEEEEEKADEEMQEGDDGEAGDKIGKGGKDQKEARDEVLEEEVEAANDKIGNQIKDGKDAEEEQGAAEEMRVANEEQSTEDDKKAFQDKEEDANMEADQIMEDGKKASLDKQMDANMEEATTKKAPALQGKEQEACGEKLVEEEEQEAHKEVQNAKNTIQEEEDKAKKVSLDQGSQPRPGPIEFNDLAAAFASMDARRLVKLIHTNVGISTEFHAAMHHAPDGAVLSLRVVDLFLHDKTLKTDKVWSNCVGLIRTVPEVVTKLSTESIEQAKRLAKVWKEMVDNPGSCPALGCLASWGLLNFLSSYNIVSEFDTNEIFRIFGTIPHKHQRNPPMIFKGLGLADRIPELMDYLIGNGQHMNVLYLAPFLKLVDKYPPLSLLKGYIKKAKQTVKEISQKDMTCQSLREVIIKELDNLRLAHDLTKQHITDSYLYSSIMAEIYVLLGEFGRRKQNLADASVALTSNPQQQQNESKKKRKKEQEQEHCKGQENHQQRQQSKPGEKLEKKQNKPQQEQQQKKQKKLQQEQQQKPQEKQQKNQHQHSKRRRRRTPKLSAWASFAAQNVLVPLRGHYAHGVHHGFPAQPGWPGVHYAPPPAPQLGGSEYVGPSNPFYPHPQFYT